jgi:hypothetical protein
MKRIVTLAAWLVAVSTPALAQSPAVIEAVAGVERAEYRYRFENDSSFDTAFLVPHFFEQRYERTAPQLGARVRYRLRKRDMTTLVAVAPESNGFGSDFDTFFQPGGDVAKSGTAGGVDLSSLRVEQEIALAERRGAAFALFLGWRRDRADFAPADRVVTHTSPPSETRTFITDRERTVSQTFELGVAGTVRADMKTWKVEASARLVPGMLARLLVQLPDKYPGRDIIFSTTAWSGSGSFRITRHAGRAVIGAWTSVEQSGAYRRSADFERTIAAAGVLIAFEARR